MLSSRRLRPLYQKCIVSVGLNIALQETWLRPNEGIKFLYILEKKGGGNKLPDVQKQLLPRDSFRK